WLPMAYYFQALTLVGILHPYMRYNINVLKVKGRSDLVLKLNVIRKSIMVVLIICAIPFGITGLILSQSVLSICAIFLSASYSSKMIDYSLREQFKDTYVVYIVSFSIGAILFGFSTYVQNMADF